MLDKYNDVLMINDIMEILCIGRSKAYQLINGGEIKSLRVGKKIRIPKVYMMDYLTRGVYNESSNMLSALASTEKGA